MNKAELLDLIADYQKNKGWFRKIIPGFQNWWPKVSFKMSRLIRLTNKIVPAPGFSQSEFNLFEISKPFRIELEKLVQTKTWGFTEAIFQTIRTILQREKAEAIADATKRAKAAILDEAEKTSAAIQSKMQMPAEAKTECESRPTSVATTRNTSPTSPHSSSRAVTPAPQPVRSVPAAKMHPTIITRLQNSSDDSAIPKKKKLRRKHTDASPIAPASAHLLILTSASTPIPLHSPSKPVDVAPAVLSELKSDAEESAVTSPVTGVSLSSGTNSPASPVVSLETPPPAISPAVNTAPTSVDVDKSLSIQNYNTEAALQLRQHSIRIARAGIFAMGMGAVEFTSALSEGQLLASVPRAVLSTLVYGAISYGAESNSTIMTMASTLLSLSIYGASYKTAVQAGITAVGGLAVNQLFRR